MLKLKGISICFSVLKAALSGSYVNFGVFRLYGDEALDNALQTFVKLLLSVPHSDLLVMLHSRIFFFFCSIGICLLICRIILTMANCIYVLTSKFLKRTICKGKSNKFAL